MLKTYRFVIVVLLLQTVFWATSIAGAQIFSLERLEIALKDYRQLAADGEWPLISDGPELKIGDKGERVRALRKRLELTGDLPNLIQEDPTLFDASLDMAVRRFQERHGLWIDGIVGPNTRRALNLSAQARIKQLEVNLTEMKRYLPLLEERYLLVNIPAFELQVVENGAVVLEMKVIVGTRWNPTPVLNGELTHLVFNPSWIIPSDTALRSLIPKLQNDPSYLMRKKMKVYNGWGRDSRELTPERVDWSAVTRQDFSFRFVQEPGPNNPMGVVKFKFPNAQAISFHDTPNRYLFNKTVRAFSNGCVRLSEPIKLAQYLLQAESEWTAERVVAAIQGGETESVHLSEPLPVHLVYWTAWVAENGQVHFRDDIYRKE